MRYNEVEVLLVEDNPHEAQLALRMFKKYNLGNRLLHIDEGLEALDFVFARGKYAERQGSTALRVIFLDLKLPRIDGLEILKQIKSDERTRTIPIVILTSSKEESDLAAAYKLGANSYIVKPVDFETFSTTISALANFWIYVNQPFISIPKAKNEP
ncbi:MAG TPA: response regulator [Chitinophagales bacterium]|nr:response regulator [Chitinophagales bacterium]